METIVHRFIETNGIRMHIAEAGQWQGPLVVLLHGFPELWYSWRSQIEALAQAGYHVVAPDLRGYGQTDRPQEVEKYTQLHLVGDVIGLLDGIGAQQASIVGHDWGAILAWDVALLRPDRVKGVAALSVPYWPRREVSFLKALHAALGDDFYMHQFQQPGLAETEIEADVRAYMLQLFFLFSGEKTPGEMPPSPSEVHFPWISDQDMEYYVSEFERTGYTGALNWYRTIEKSWECMAAWMNTPIQPPALYMVGDQDLVFHLPGSQELITHLRSMVPRLTRTVVLPRCGHWIQQERSAEVNAALLEFFQTLSRAERSDQFAVNDSHAFVGSY